jgi:hypothetical protein
MQLLGNLLKVPGFTLRTPFINFDVKKIGLRLRGQKLMRTAPPYPIRALSVLRIKTG